MRRFLAALGLAAFALAQPATPARAVTLGAEGFSAFNTHAMEFWNTDLELANRDGGHFGRLGHTFTTGVNARVGIERRWLLLAGWEPISLESRDQRTGRALVFDAMCFRFGLARFAPSRGAARWGAGAGVGWYDLHGRREYGGVPNARLTGYTVGLDAQALGEWTVRPGLSLTGALGYRNATIADTKVDGASNSPRLVTDYSGLLVRVGLAYDRGPLTASSGSRR